MKKSVIVLGAGGHARVLIDALKLLKIRIVGATDAHPSAVDRKVLGIPLLGKDDELAQYSPAKCVLVNGVGTIKVNSIRQKIFEKYKGLGFSFMTVVHPKAIISPRVILREGSQIMAGAILQTGVSVGVNSIINTNVSVDHDCVIEEHAHIAPGVLLCGHVKIGAKSHIGPGVIITNGVTVKDGSFIKAGSLVTQHSISEFLSARRVKS